MNRTKRTLQLRSITIRTLEYHRLSDAVGGVIEQPKSTVAPNCACWPDPLPPFRTPL